MTTARGRIAGIGPVLTYAVGLLGFAYYTRSFLTAFARSSTTPFTFWDSVLYLIGSGYVVCFWVIPMACWFALRRLGDQARFETLIRYSTRTDWALAQGIKMLPNIVAMVVVLLLVALAASAGLPFSWAWGPSSGDPDVLLQLPELTPIQPVPILSVAIQLLALAGSLFGMTVVIARAATILDHPRAAALTALGLVMWTIGSFQTGGWFSAYLGTATYALSWRGALELPLGPAGSIAAMLVVGAVVYAAARWGELRWHELDRPSPLVVVTLCGAATVWGLAAVITTGQSTPSEAIMALLRGVGVEGAALLEYVGSVLLTLLPAIALNRDLVASLSGRRIAEMIRVQSPAHWFARRIPGMSRFCALYAAALAGWSVFQVGIANHVLPDRSALELAALWAFALFLQSLVASVLLALGTALAQRAEGGAYAVGAILLLSWPMGAASRWSPFGQASLARLADGLPGAAAQIDLSPVGALVLWFAALVFAVFIVINRTRGEID